MNDIADITPEAILDVATVWNIVQNDLPPQKSFVIHRIATA